MKKYTYILCFIILISSCNKYNKEYNNNRNHYNLLVEEINDFYIDSTINEIEISEYFTDNFVFHSYMVGNRKGEETKKDVYIDGYNFMKKMNVSINICHTIYLPGLDENTYKLNGSVRLYYGAVLSVDTNQVEYSGYQTINFKNGKISEIWEWADYSGVSEQLNYYLKD